MEDHSDKGALAYEADIIRLMRKLIRAHAKGTGSKLSRDDVSLLWMEAGLLIEEVHDRAKEAVGCSGTEGKRLFIEKTHEMFWKMKEEEDDG